MYPKIHKFKFDVMTFKYFDENKNTYVEVPNKNMIIKEDFFAARFADYELGFQVNVFEDKKNQSCLCQNMIIKMINF